ncbi:DUF421 domain-containing protein [Clostridium botulinum]|nr:DUF421 domain-containing protein [Clostridium botulinum]
MNEALVVLVRAIIGFFTLLIFARMLGKQQISQLTFFDYVLGITIGSTASTLSTDLESTAWSHWIGLLTWCGIGFLLQWITLNWRYAAKYIEGEPTIVIMDGKIMEDTLRKMKYTVADVLEQLRGKDIFDLSKVEFAILESDGQLSVLKKPEEEPLTAKDLNIFKSKTGISRELIYDGKIVEDNLREINRDKEWLKAELKKRNIKDSSDVFLATINENNQIYIDTYKDHLKRIIDIGDYKGPY